MLAIFDKDGTLVRPASGGEFVQGPEDQILLPGVAERMQELKEMGARIVIASNQGGVEAGHKSLESAIAEIKFCCELVAGHSAYICPDFKGELCYGVHKSSDGWRLWEMHTIFQQRMKQGLRFRKPSPGMLIAAKDTVCYPRERLYQEAWMIGDRPEDHQAAIAAGIGFVDAAAWREGRALISPSAVISLIGSEMSRTELEFLAQNGVRNPGRSSISTIAPARCNQKKGGSLEPVGLLARAPIISARLSTRGCQAGDRPPATAPLPSPATPLSPVPGSPHAFGWADPGGIH